MNKLIMILTVVITCMAYAQKDNALPVKVYVMVGQSNMQGHAHIEANGRPNTLKDIVEKDTEKKFQFLVNEDGSWRERSDVWIQLDGKVSGLKPGYGANPNSLGPELGFGHKVGDTTEAQVLIIKTCWGGKSLGGDFLPPRIGKYPKPYKPGDPGFYYSEILRIVKDVTRNMKKYFPDYQGQGFEIAGLCFHQGWNDQYGGLDAKYETNLVAFINEIREDLGVPNLPIVIATSGMIQKDTPIKTGQLAMADTTKYPQFVGNVAVIDTDKPYGPDKLQFFFDRKNSPRDQEFHWNGNARTHLNIGFAMAAEMAKLNKPELPSRLGAFGVDNGVQLTWQAGTDVPKTIELIRNGESLGSKPFSGRTAFVDASALPGKNDYELVVTMASGSTKKLTVSCDTSAKGLTAYRSKDGVQLTWTASGKYDGFKISRSGTVIEASLDAAARTYEDKQAPKEGNVVYIVEPTTGNVTPATFTINLGPIDAGDAVFYEPFDYPAGLPLLGQSGAVGSKGEYYTLDPKEPKWKPMVKAGNRPYGTIPETGNRMAGHHWGKGCAIDLDDSIRNAGLLNDGATMWISFVYHINANHIGAQVSLQSSDMKEAIGFFNRGATNTFIIQDGKRTDRLLTSGTNTDTTYLFVAKIVWGKGGEPDSFLPYHVKRDLKLPLKPGRFLEPFNIDQSKLSRLALEGGGACDVDEIRIGKTFESVVGGGTMILKEAETVKNSK